MVYDKLNEAVSGLENHGHCVYDGRLCELTNGRYKIQDPYILKTLHILCVSLHQHQCV